MDGDLIAGFQSSGGVVASAGSTADQHVVAADVGLVGEIGRVVECMGRVKKQQGQQWGGDRAHRCSPETVGRGEG